MPDMLRHCSPSSSGARPARSRRATVLARALNAMVTLCNNIRRIALSSATLMMAMTSIALGTYAGFTAQTVNPGNTFATGSLGLTSTLGAASGSGAFTFGPMAIADMVPGETMVKFLDITSTGTIAFSYTMSGVASSSSALDTDATNGLQLNITQCSVAWTGTDSCPSGSVTPRYTGRIAPMTGQPVALGTIAAGAGNKAFLQVKVSLPSTATALSNLSSTIDLTWTATQS